MPDNYVPTLYKKSVHKLQGKGVPESVGEADEAVLKLAGVYK